MDKLNVLEQTLKEHLEAEFQLERAIEKTTLPEMQRDLSARGIDLVARRRESDARVFREIEEYFDGKATKQPVTDRLQSIVKFGQRMRDGIAHAMATFMPDGRGVLSAELGLASATFNDVPTEENRRQVVPECERHGIAVLLVELSEDEGDLLLALWFLKGVPPDAPESLVTIAGTAIAVEAEWKDWKEYETSFKVLRLKSLGRDIDDLRSRPVTIEFSDANSGPLRIEFEPE